MLCKHIKAIHLEEDRTCVVYSERFDTNKSVEQHMKNTHYSQGSNCTLCGKWMRNEAYKRVHMRWHRKVEMKKLEKCPLCPYETMNPSRIVQHVKMAHGEPKLGCELCGKKYRSNTGLKEHRDSELHSKNLEQRGLVDVWRLKEQKWNNDRLRPGTWESWGKMTQFVTQEEADRLMEEYEKNTTVITSEEPGPAVEQKDRAELEAAVANCV